MMWGELWSGITVKWCHFRNAPDCFSCSTICRYPPSFGSCITEILCEYLVKPPEAIASVIPIDVFGCFIPRSGIGSYRKTILLCRLYQSIAVLLCERGYIPREGLNQINELYNKVFYWFTWILLPESVHSRGGFRELRGSVNCVVKTIQQCWWQKIISMCSKPVLQHFNSSKIPIEPLSRLTMRIHTLTRGRVLVSTTGSPKRNNMKKKSAAILVASCCTTGGLIEVEWEMGKRI